MKSQSKNKGDSTESGLKELFLTELKDIYWAEKALVKALPKMAKKATSQELVDAIDEHLSVTETHVERIEQVFETLGEKASAKKCEAMEGLIEEAEEMMSEIKDGVVRDAAIISAAQKVEHYEIASYGTLVSFANTLGESKVAEILEQTLNEEKEADQMLTEIATSSINLDAANEEEE
jgi:ferritin-like metal-binding protein YciE